MMLLLLKLSFILMEHPPRDWKLFFTEGNWFRFEKLQEEFILSVTGCSTPNPKDRFFPSQSLPTCGRTCSVHSLHQVSFPFYLAPVGLPIMFLTLLTKHYLPMGSLGAQLQGGSHLSLVTDKLKHDDIFNRPFVNILPCWKLRRVPSPLDHI